MRRKIVVLTLAIAVACAGMVPPQAPRPPPTSAVESLSRSHYQQAARSEVARDHQGDHSGCQLARWLRVATSGMSKFLFDKLSGPLAQAGFGFAMNALGLNKLLHVGSPDQAALEQVQEQLKVISAQIQQLQGDLQTTFGAIKQGD